MEKIRNSIKCAYCTCVLDAPILLPCGNCICQRHVEANDGRIFDCSLCHEIHSIPNDGFCRVKALDDIIKSGIDKLDFGVVYNDAVASCQQLEQLIQNLVHLQGDPTHLVDATIDKIKNQIEIKREEYKLKVDEEMDKIISELCEFQDECKAYFNTLEYEKISQELDRVIENSNSQLDHWLNELNAMAIDNEKWQNINNECLKAIDDLKLETENFKNHLLLNRLGEMQLKLCELDDLLDVRPDKRFESKILNFKLSQEMVKLCEFKDDDRFRLLYRASEDGFSSEAFHNKCDNEPCTLTIIKTTNGSIFGGYTEAVWDKSEGYKADKNAFVFGLVNRSNTKLKITISDGYDQCAIYCSSIEGPSFGESAICISDNSNAGALSYSYLDSFFKSPLHTTCPARNNEILNGEKHFQTLEIEIYRKFDK